MTEHVPEQIVGKINTHTREAVEAILAGEAVLAFDAIDKGAGRVIEQGDDAMRYAAKARDRAQLSSADHERTLVLDPSREGRKRLTDAMRAELVRDGTLGPDAITVTMLEPLGLTRAEAFDAASYAPRPDSHVPARQPQASAKHGSSLSGRCDRRRGGHRLVPHTAGQICYLVAGANGRARRSVRRSGAGAAQRAASRSSARTASRRHSTSHDSPIGISGRVAPHDTFRPGRDRRSGHGASGELPRQPPRCSGGICRHHPRQGRGRSTPTAAPVSPKRSAYATERRSGRSMGRGRRWG